ncbi:MAG: hypothetical protein SOZ34_05990 [Clostridia bacterium]|nr:hypothetical protein [Clostridia bacterium]
MGILNANTFISRNSIIYSPTKTIEITMNKERILSDLTNAL